MGADNLASIKKWKNYEILLRDYKIAVYPRPGFENPGLADHSSITITDTPVMEISSTFIRKAIKSGQSVQYMIPEKVFRFIDSKNLYG